MNKELSANAILSHYRIVSKISAGGMGEVYRAYDSRKSAGIFWPNETTMTPDGTWYVYKLNRFLSDLYMLEALK